MKQAKEAKECDCTPKDIQDDFVVKYHFEGKYKSTLIK